MRSFTALLFVWMAFTTAAAAKPLVAVTTCGQVVPKSAVGYLTADLDCNGFRGAPGAVVLATNATLDLRGFTLTTDDIYGVYCGGLTEKDGGLKACQVENGTITGPTGQGVTGRRVRARDLVITDAGLAGITADGPLKAENLQVSGCGSWGVRADSVRVEESTFTANGQIGILSAKGLRMRSSSASGNGTDPDCGMGEVCADIESGRRPVLIDSSCGTSLSGYQSPHSWGVCTLD